MIVSLKEFVEDGAIDLQKINCGNNQTKEDTKKFREILE